MTERLDAFAVVPAAFQPFHAVEKSIKESGLEYSLIELVKLRASQINGCAFCIHMHTADARAAGETEERLHLVAAWWESPLYTPRERAALAWTESLTLIAERRAPDAVYDALKAEFTEPEIVWLTLLITTINMWNRMAVGFRKQHPVGWAKTAAAA